MAKQNGIIKLKGTIEDISFYKSIDGHMARRKGGVDAERIKNDPKFIRVRENNAEFGGAAQSAKLLRRSIRPLLKSASDPRMPGRLIGTMNVIKNLDLTGARGKRNVGAGVTHPDAARLLTDIAFNKHAHLGEVLQLDYAVDTATGIITIPELVPLEDLSFPPGVTHFSTRGAWLKIDFTSGAKQIRYTNTVTLPIDTTQTDVELTPMGIPTGSGISLYFLLVAFYQEVNGVQYSMQNGAYNALGIVAVL